jgi:hypothetical protein
MLLYYTAIISISSSFHPLKGIEVNFSHTPHHNVAVVAINVAFI